MNNENKLVVLPQRLAEEYRSDSPWACVSITDPMDSEARINKCQLVDVLRPQFKDIDFEDEFSFTVEHADQILDFVKKWWDEIDVLVIHCYAGRCRSPAVAAIVSKIYYGNDMKWFKGYTPNMLVYRKLWLRVNEREDFPEIR